MKKKTIIRFYAFLVLIGFNAILWTYMWQEFKNSNFLPAAIAVQNIQQAGKQAQNAKLPQEMKESERPAVNSTVRPISTVAIQKPSNSSVQKSKEKSGGEAPNLLEYERTLYEVEWHKGGRDKYASLVEDQIINGERGDEIDYTVLKEAGSVFRDISKQFDSVRVPETLSDESKSAAYEAKALFGEAYWHKADAMALLANYLDTGDLEWAKKYERKIEKSEEYRKDGIHALINQEAKLGIDASASVYQQEFGK